MLRLITLVKPLAGYMMAAVAMGVAGFLCAQFITILGGYAMLDVLKLHTGISISAIFVLVLVLAVLRAVLKYGEQSCNHFIAFKLLAIIRDHVFKALRKLCPAKLEGRDKGDLISVITSDIELLEVFYAHTISPVCIAFIMSVIMSIFIGSYSVVLGVIAALAYIAVGVFVPVMISKKSGTLGESFRRQSGQLSGYVLESLRGLDEEIQYSYGEKRLDDLKLRTDFLSLKQEKMSVNVGFNTAITNSVILIFDIIMLVTSVSFYRNGTVGLEGVIIPLVALMSSFGPVVALANLGTTLQNTLASGGRVLDILDESPVTEEITDGRDITFSGAKAENVTFSYGEEKILDGLSLDIEKGKITGIIGRSGSGKSTLLKLFMRFWKTQGGRIAVSDEDIDSINTASLRNAESFVTQETELFHDSIENNIRIAKLDATHDEVISACKKASIHDFIMTLPEDYDTNVGELGSTLSGGERQRIGLARAFLHDAPFMLLDEPTSNLDSLNEAVILKALRDDGAGRTVALVSHRKSTMCICDKVYSVENGRLS
ncbi:amino acid ABC transporter ATP-binding/permease protein [Ruminococcus sp.]|uniref:amino acid ABC transporter ATP-binding/permease protein n=1 Tax=Ruminococcus sp. TaxID=41978 RepID=UPI003AB34034